MAEQEETQEVEQPRELGAADALGIMRQMASNFTANGTDHQLIAASIELLQNVVIEHAQMKALAAAPNRAERRAKQVKKRTKAKRK